MTARRHCNLTRRVLVIAGTALLLAACALPPADSATDIPANELPPELLNTTTTSTTTTVATTLPLPVSTAPPDNGTLVETTTTTSTTLPLFDFTEVEMFYVPPGVAEEVQRIPLRLLSPVSVDDLTAALATEPPELLEYNIRTAVRPDLINGVTVVRGTAEVDLSQEALDRMAPSQELRAIAQIVLTLTSFVTQDDQGAIAFVSFSVDGVPSPVNPPGRSSTSPGESVAFVDYRELIKDRGTIDTSTSTTVTSTTTPETTAPQATTTTGPDIAEPTAAVTQTTTA